MRPKWHTTMKFKVIPYLLFQKPVTRFFFFILNNFTSFTLNQTPTSSSTFRLNDIRSKCLLAWLIDKTERAKYQDYSSKTNLVFNINLHTLNKKTKKTTQLFYQTREKQPKWDVFCSNENWFLNFSTWRITHSFMPFQCFI